jgi:hypothetical protein
MCDYSLEMYRSRPATAGERYETRRFPSGSIGFTAPGDATTAVCMACDIRLELMGVPAPIQQELDIPSNVAATFVRIDVGPYHDGIRFSNGKEVTLQRLGPGVMAEVVDDLARPLPDIHREFELVR